MRRPSSAGASPDTVAATVATPLERALGAIAGVVGALLLGRPLVGLAGLLGVCGPLPGLSVVDGAIDAAAPRQRHEGGRKQYGAREHKRAGEPERDAPGDKPSGGGDHITLPASVAFGVGAFSPNSISFSPRRARK